MKTPQNKECKRCGLLKSTIDSCGKTCLRGSSHVFEEEVEKGQLQNWRYCPKCRIKFITADKSGSCPQCGHDDVPYQDQEIKCDCVTKHCMHYESDFDRFVKENPKVESEEWEQEMNRRFFTIFNFIESQTGTTERLAVASFIRSEKLKSREEMREEVERWAYDNGITDKKSFAALIKFLSAIKVK